MEAQFSKVLASGGDMETFLKQMNADMQTSIKSQNEQKLLTSSIVNLIQTKVNAPPPIKQSAEISYDPILRQLQLQKEDLVAIKSQLSTTQTPTTTTPSTYLALPSLDKNADKIIQAHKTALDSVYSQIKQLETAGNDEIKQLFTTSLASNIQNIRSMFDTNISSTKQILADNDTKMANHIQSLQLSMIEAYTKSMQDAAYQQNTIEYTKTLKGFKDTIEGLKQMTNNLPAMLVSEMGKQGTERPSLPALSPIPTVLALPPVPTPMIDIQQRQKKVDRLKKGTHLFRMYARKDTLSEQDRQEVYKAADAMIRNSEGLVHDPVVTESITAFMDVTLKALEKSEDVGEKSKEKTKDMMTQAFLRVAKEELEKSSKAVTSESVKAIEQALPKTVPSTTQNDVSKELIALAVKSKEDTTKLVTMVEEQAKAVRESSLLLNTAVNKQDSIMEVLKPAMIPLGTQNMEKATIALIQAASNMETVGNNVAQRLQGVTSALDIQSAPHTIQQPLALPAPAVRPEQIEKIQESLTKLGKKSHDIKRLLSENKPNTAEIEYKVASAVQASNNVIHENIMAAIKQMAGHITASTIGSITEHVSSQLTETRREYTNTLHKNVLQIKNEVDALAKQVGQTRTNQNTAITSLNNVVSSVERLIGTIEAQPKQLPYHEAPPLLTISDAAAVKRQVDYEGAQIGQLLELIQKVNNISDRLGSDTEKTARLESKIAQIEQERQMEKQRFEQQIQNLTREATEAKDAEKEARLKLASSRLNEQLLDETKKIADTQNTVAMEMAKAKAVEQQYTNLTKLIMELKTSPNSGSEQLQQQLNEKEKELDRFKKQLEQSVQKMQNKANEELTSRNMIKNLQQKVSDLERQVSSQSKSKDVRQMATESELAKIKETNEARIKELQKQLEETESNLRQKSVELVNARDTSGNVSSTDIVNLLTISSQILKHEQALRNEKEMAIKTAFSALSWASSLGPDHDSNARNTIEQVRKIIEAINGVSGLEDEDVFKAVSQNVELAIISTLSYKDNSALTFLKQWGKSVTENLEKVTNISKAGRLARKNLKAILENMGSKMNKNARGYKDFRKWTNIGVKTDFGTSLLETFDRHYQDLHRQWGLAQASTQITLEKAQKSVEKFESELQQGSERGLKRQRISPRDVENSLGLAWEVTKAVANWQEKTIVDFEQDLEKAVRKKKREEALTLHGQNKPTTL